MNRYVRYVLLLIALGQAFLAAAFLLKIPIAVQLWPLPYSSDLSYFFIASIIAAASASTLWCVLANEPGALVGVALDYITIFTPVSIHMMQLAGNTRGTLSTRILAFAVFCAISAMFGLGLLLWSRRYAIHDTRPMPRLLRVSFAAFVIALLVGGTWVLNDSSVMPWNISSDVGVLYGWFFIGAAAYFAYGLLRPSWHNAAGQLAGFLAYDLVLIVPFFNLLQTIPDRLRFNLLIYSAIVIYSALLAIYYLFIHAATRSPAVVLHSESEAFSQ